MQKERKKQAKNPFGLMKKERKKERRKKKEDEDEKQELEFAEGFRRIKKTIFGFSYSKNIANFDVFLNNFLLNTIVRCEL